MIPVNSVDDIRQVWARDGLNIAMIHAEDFLQEATRDKREDVKALLIEIVKGKYEVNSSQAISWLANYDDPTLVPLFLEFLQDEMLQIKILHVLTNWVHDGIIQLADKRVVELLVKLLSQGPSYNTREVVMDTFAAFEAISVIDLVVEYLSDPHPAVRASAARCVLHLSKKAGREDFVEKVVPLLQDPHQAVSLRVALAIKEYYPNRFPTLDPKDYWPNI